MTSVRSRLRRWLLGALTAAVVLAVAALTYQLPGGPALCGAFAGLAAAGWVWYLVTVGREARGGHLWWPGNVSDRWS